MPASDTAPSRRPHLVVTGGCGFLGSRMVEHLREEFDVTVMDVAAPPDGSPDGYIPLSVTEIAQWEESLTGVDALILAHMAPRGTYHTAALPFDINVKGTAQMFEAALRKGVRRVVLISSAGVLEGALGTPITVNTPPCPRSLYALTKELQEHIARYYHSVHGVEVACLRPAHVVCEGTLADKYGKRFDEASWRMIDPSDIARAAAAAVRLPQLGFEIFHLFAHPEGEALSDAARAREILGWEPVHRFDTEAVGSE